MKTTKLVLTREVPNLGVAGDVVTVAGGYARNYLLPRKFAFLWTKGAQAEIDNLARARRRREIASVQNARAARDAIVAAGSITIAKRAGDTGRLFGAVTAADVAAALVEKLAVKVDRRQVSVESIKRVGEYVANIKLHADVDTEIKVNVVAE